MRAYRTDRTARTRPSAARRLNPCRRQGSISRRVSCDAGPRDGIDEVLILPLLRAARDRKGLTMGLRLEGRRANVGHPHLDWPQPLPPQAFPMRLDLVARPLRSRRCRRVLACPALLRIASGGYM